MDLIEEGFRSKYESVCVGNKPKDAQHVFFEGLLLQEGLGTHMITSVLEHRAVNGSANHLSVGRKENWYGHSSWGHPDYTRKAVRPINSRPFSFTGAVLSSCRHTGNPYLI